MLGARGAVAGGQCRLRWGCFMSGRDRRHVLVRSLAPQTPPVSTARRAKKAPLIVRAGPSWTDYLLTTTTTVPVGFAFTIDATAA